MASAMRVFRKFRASDGRIKVATLSGVSALVAVIALLVGVLPVMANHVEGEPKDSEHPLVAPVPLDEGGGDGKCFVETDGMPSAAGNEYHINNPTEGSHTLEVDGNVVIEVIVEGPTDNRQFSFEVFAEDVVVYDVAVNGGPKSNHYDYDDNGFLDVTFDAGLHAPAKGNKLHNLSHINICYDEPGKVLFACDDDPVKLTDEDGFITVAAASIFANSDNDCTDKRGLFRVNSDDNSDDTVTLAFEGDTGVDVAGRLDITKDFDNDGDNDPTDFENLQYDGPGVIVDLQWCAIRSPKVTGDMDEFDTVLASNEYPSLAGVKDNIGTPEDPVLVDATACKVSEEENAAGVQLTIVYFEFEDPTFY